MKNTVIIGAGDLGKEIVWLIEDINKRQPTNLILGFLDDDTAKAGTEFYGYKVLGGTDLLRKLSTKMPLSAVIAIQDGSIRKKIVEEHPEFTSWETIIHPTAVIAGSSYIGKGSVFFPQVTVSVDTRLGSFGLYYIHSTICNDCKIGDYVSVMTGASVSEHVEIGDECFLSAGSTVYPHRKINNKAQI
ncbi:MAG: transferase [Clostridia bacterium]|nr:transferase [Clostridia bacterium]